MPDDADVRVDTTGRTIPDALDDVIVALRGAGYLDLPLSTQEPLVEEARQRRLETEAPETTDQPPVEEARQRRLETKASEEPLKVLFVCTANICRSPFMELTARHLAGDSPIEFRSAGTHGFTDHPINPEMAVTLAPRGITSHEEFRSRPLTKTELDWADVVLTAEADHRQFILDDHPALFRKVFTLGQFVDSLVGQDSLHGRELLTAVGAHRTTASSELDVADPYRRGPEACERAAAHIESLLRTALAALVPQGSA